MNIESIKGMGLVWSIVAIVVILSAAAGAYFYFTGFNGEVSVDGVRVSCPGFSELSPEVQDQYRERIIEILSTGGLLGDVENLPPGCIIYEE